VYAGLPYAAANLVSLVAGILFSFRTQSAWVFNDAHDPRLGRFILAWGVLYLLNIALISGAMRLGLDAYLAGATVLPVIVGVSYFVLQRFVFKGRP